MCRRLSFALTLDDPPSDMERLRGLRGGILRSLLRRRHDLRASHRADAAGVRILYTFGLYAGGPAALWSSMLITIFFMVAVAASLAEICSAVPLSGASR